MGEIKTVRTGIKVLDEMLGGGLLDDSTLLIVYNTYSFGWALGVQIFRKLVDSGGFGVVSNYSFPISLLVKYAGAMGYDFIESGEKGDLVIIDVFGSTYDIRSDLPFVYYTGKLGPENYLAEMVGAYRGAIEDHLGGRKPIGISVTLDGLAGLFGEESTIRVLKRNLAMKEAARMSEDRKRPINIFLLNKDRVSERFISWVGEYSEHIVEFTASSSPGVERMAVRKSLLPDFVPRTAEFRFKKGRIGIFPG
ncbi:hypothetical protein [Thermococcus sp. Bubb.Bath]|uniref:hypothetical protein n=1 Tax=Thermococcus sp. Bubb.Bath TaxID=1638242 RepID=UPI0014396D2D|nr:hypothetical protein [Thermococcus sp. Bubb.Bath]NJF25134.1 hypothetical protein [Thermococcus sp. Bubb.Bath]